MMKLAACALLLTSVFACAPAGESSALPPEGSVRHVVVFRYRPDATAAQIQEVTDAFRALQDSIPGILAFEHGANHSPEGQDQGFNHVYTLTFEDAAARDAYLPHPRHAAFGQLLGRLAIHEDVFVVDYDPQP
jgi:hypothetical protein